MNNELFAKYLQAGGTVLIGAALLTGVIMGVRSYNNTYQTHTLRVTGKATRQLPPNQSTLTGSWLEKAATADEARSKLNTSSTKGLEALKAAGIEEKNITTTQVTVYPEYDYSGAVTYKEPKITGYQASLTMEAKLSDTTKADAIIAVMTQNGAQSTSGPSLSISTEMRDQIERELRVAAVADAANQAQALAKESGGKLGAVISVTDGYGRADTPNPIPYAIAEDAKSSVGSSLPTSAISVGEKEITVTVDVSYELK